MLLKTDDQIKKELKFAFWDIKIDVAELLLAITNPDNNQYPIEKKSLFARLLTGLEWYTLIKTVPKEKWDDLFSEETIKKVWPKSLQNKFIYAGSKLLQRPLSSAG